MRARALFVVLTALVGVTACGGDYPAATPAPTAVGCTDAPDLRQRALADRRLSEEAGSSQAKISSGTRASVYASLAIVAELKCKVALAGVDEALKPALEAARRAVDAGNFSDTASAWAEANFRATQVIELLVQQLPVPAK